MKLLRCHIENFGVLHDYDYTFSPGLTVICEENGFGKSTFAAFLKAMFYGLPRTGARNVVDNERKRYDPWQGGKYGGFLEFEYQGTQYRVTRYFGKTANKDSFSMMDLTSRQAETPFTEKLGEELFQLDAESFARSTYMPQTSGRELEATASIRTKLADLVDNTNDMNNFDTASTALRQYRGKYRAFRGSGGLIGDLEREYNALDAQKFEAEGKRPRLQEVQEEIEGLDGEKRAETDRVSSLREGIRRASAQKTMLLRRDQLRDLREAVDRQQEILKNLDGRYPAGCPTPEEIRTQRENLSAAQQETQRLETLAVSLEDRTVLQREGTYFTDLDQVSRDMDACEQQCGALTEVSARRKDRMLPEEAGRLEALSVKFAQGIPDRQEVETCLTAADAMNEAQLRLSALTMPTERQEKFEELKRLFQQGVPGEETLNACQTAQQDWILLQKRRETCALSEKEREEYRTLQRTFASGIPSEEEIHDRQKDCRRILELTSIKNTRTTRVQTETPAEQPRSRGPLLLGILGVLLLAAGIACFALDLTLPGVLLFVVGLAGLLGAFWLHTSRMAAGRGKAASLITASAITDQENQELYDLQRGLNDFLLRFFPDIADPEGKLVQLLLDRKTFEDLKQKRAALEKEREEIEREIEEKERTVHRVFDRYFPGKPYGNAFVQELREKSREYEALLGQMSDLARQREELTEKIGAYRAEILELLHRYYPVELPADLRQGLRELASDADAFGELSRKKQAMEAENAQYRAQQEALTGQIREILGKYGVENTGETFLQSLRELRRRLEVYRAATERAAHVDRDRQEAQARRDRAEKEIRQFLLRYRLTQGDPETRIDEADQDFRSREAAERNLREAQDRLSAFLTENPDVEDSAAEDGTQPDPEALQTEEKQTQERLDTIEARLRELRQERDTLRRTVENIPGWEDQMARLETQRQEAQKKCDLVDRTMALLDQAKDNLANSYVGKVEQGFAQYAGTLLGDRLGHVIVDKNLKLYMDEQGAAREVGSFSAGMVDGILLCMRLSLVDALFTKEKPFLILDDPFVNLDDEHTKRALEILRRIARDHQVLYLVCNTSRT